jgi:hypothetical protein
VAIGTVALAALAYRLIDVFLLLSIGMAVAAALPGRPLVLRGISPVGV